MKNRTVKLVCGLLALLFLLNSLPAIAASDPALWAAPAGETPETARPISAVQWWYDNEDATYYLFMPSEGSLSRLQVWFTGAESCTIDGSPVTDGAITALLSEGAHTVTFDGTAYPLQVMKSANISSMYITTESGNMNYIHAKKGNKESGMIRYVDETGAVVYDGELNEIKGRGNATWSRPKKPYQFKLPDSVDLTGAGECKTWILLANYLERTLVRNKIAYDLANDAGLSNSCESVFTDLYCNGQYMGTYQLVEKVHINDNRIEINDLEKATEKVNENDLDSYPTFGDETADGTTPGTMKGYEIPNNPEDITGGYLLELDYAYRYAEEVSGFVTERGQAVTIKEPECASREQVEYIAGFFQEFEDAVFADNGINPETGKHYSEYFDLTSLARKYIVEEFTCNIDADVTSQYFYKPSDSESTTGFCGPVWDYDNSMGNYRGSDNPEGLYASAKKNYIFKNLYKKTDFLNAVRAEWEASFLPVLKECLGLLPSSEETLILPFEEYQTLLAPSAAMNFTYWTNLDTEDHSGYIDTGSTYQEHFDTLRSFLTARTEYLTSIWSSAEIDLLPAAGDADPADAGVPNILNYTAGHSTYIIDSAEGLQKAADLVSSGVSFENVTLLQTCDITLTETFVPGGYSNTDNKNVSPTGNDTFKGTYNGQGYKIYNLNINQPENNGVGIFASAYQATFLDMHVASGTVIGFNRTAAIAGFGDKCTFIRCSNGAEIIANAEGIDGNAGLAGVGRNGASFISCYNTGRVYGGVAAGICGWGQTSATLQNCYNTGTIESPSDSSSSAQALSRTGGTLDFSSCFYLSESAHETNGAAVFTQSELTDGTLLNQLNAGSAVWTAGESHPEQAAGARADLVRLTRNTYANGELIHTERSYYPTGETAVIRPENQAFLKEVWLNGQPTEERTALLTGDAVVDIHLSLSAASILDYNGAGTYYISTAEELEAFLTRTHTDPMTDSKIYLLADIDATGLSGGGTFGGTLNGKFSRISGLSAPLFETIAATGDVRKLILSDAAVTGEGTVANTNNGRISYVTTRNILLTGTNPGGITGSNAGWINGCSTDGYLLSATAAGGITATNAGALQNCINNARVVVPGGTGAGIAAVSTGTIRSCINRGMLNAAVKLAIADSASESCYFWDWCTGQENGAKAYTSAELADPAMLQELPARYWVGGEASPVPAAVLYELGDANGDDAVSIADAVLLLRYLNDLIGADAVDLEASDVTGDGFYITDVIRILQYLNGGYLF